MGKKRQQESGTGKRTWVAFIEHLVHTKQAIAGRSSRKHNSLRPHSLDLSKHSSPSFFLPSFFFFLPSFLPFSSSFLLSFLFFVCFVWYKVSTCSPGCLASNPQPCCLELGLYACPTLPGLHIFIHGTPGRTSAEIQYRGPGTSDSGL